MNKTLFELQQLFEEARKVDEFEFVLVLINFRGMGTHKLTTNLYEWFEAIEFYKHLYVAHKGKEKTRIAAHIYSTFFENSDFYNIIGSLCRVALGFRSSSYLFWKTKKYERLLGIGEKQELLFELLHDANKTHIIEFFRDNHYKEIRNSFFHSAYALGDDIYIMHDSESIQIGGVGRTSFTISEFFYPIVDNVLSFFSAFKELYLAAFASYKVNKLVIGRFPYPRDIEILGSENGLQGFKAENATKFFGEWVHAGIWYNPKYDWYEARNIDIEMPKIENIEIDDQLRRYENKPDINKSDVEFQNLVDKIGDRKNPTEIERVIAVLVKFGRLRYEKMQKEENPYKRRSLAKYTLSYYRRVTEIGAELFDVSKINERINELENLIKAQ